MRRRRPDIAVVARIVVTVVLGGIGAAAGFTHTHDWASAHGQHGWLAWADAVVIEGMAVVAGFEIHRDHHTRRAGRTVTLPQAVLVIAFLIQMTAQVAQAEHSPAGWLLAAMPALGFLTVVKLTMRRIPTEPTATPALDPPDAPLPVVPAPTSPRLIRLPAGIRQTVLDTTRQAHGNGQPVTAADIGRTITLPEPLLSELVTELNNTINNHPIRTA